MPVFARRSQVTDSRAEEGTVSAARLGAQQGGAQLLMLLGGSYCRGGVTATAARAENLRLYRGVVVLPSAPPPSHPCRAARGGAGAAAVKGQGRRAAQPRGY